MRVTIYPLARSGSFKEDRSLALLLEHPSKSSLEINYFLIDIVFEGRASPCMLCIRKAGEQKKIRFVARWVVTMSGTMRQ